MRLNFYNSFFLYIDNEREIDIINIIAAIKGNKYNNNLIVFSSGIVNPTLDNNIINAAGINNTIII